MQRMYVTLGNFPPSCFTLYVSVFSRRTERTEGRKEEEGETPVNHERNKERAVRRKKKIGEHERNARRGVRKSECHCRNLRTLTSSWLVPPSSWSQSPPSSHFHQRPPFSLPPRRSLCPFSFSLTLSPARFAPSSPLAPCLSLSRHPYLPPSFAADYVSSSRKFRVFRYSLGDTRRMCGDRDATID